MKTKCIHKDLIFYLDGELPGERRAAVEKHLKECSDCRNFLAFLREQMQTVKTERNAEPSPYFYTRLSARLDKEKEPQAESSWVKLAQPAIFSLLLISGIYGGFKLGNNVSTPAANPSAASIQMLDDFKSEPIESFLLDKL